jgi:aspartate/methionine/tyrosine aminotransferase
VIADDAYFGLFYEDGVSRESVFTALANLHENVLAVKVDGATKEEFLWGFRIGFVSLAGKGLGSDALGALETKVMGTIRSMVSNCSMPAQSVLKHVLANPDYPAQKAAFNEILHRRYQTVRAILSRESVPQLTPLPFNSGYFMSFRCVDIDAEELRQKLLEEGIGTINIRGTYLRVAFAGADEEKLEDLFTRIFEAARALAD